MVLRILHKKYKRGPKRLIGGILIGEESQGVLCKGDLILMKTETLLFIVDPQNDFCDPRGALAIPGAEGDMKRLATHLSYQGDAIDHLVISLDSHHAFDIAHPSFWMDEDGHSPSPFTVIGRENLSQYRPAREDLYSAWGAYYVSELERLGRYQLMIWPEHCLIGSWGHCVYPDLFQEVQHWERRKKKQTEYVLKGLSPKTEHYSVFHAEVEDREDEKTLLHEGLLTLFLRYRTIFIAGEASSHCVRATVEDMLEYVEPSRMVLLKNAMSPVKGFEDEEKAFFEDIRRRGVRLERL